MLISAGFTYRLDRFRGPPAKVYSIFNPVIGLSQQNKNKNKNKNFTKPKAKQNNKNKQNKQA
jgi:hypothetical protein